MADAVDYYAVLGVAPTSDDVVIRAAYRALMLKYHPDTNTDARSTLKAAQINDAFKVLSDAQLRAEYDRRRTEAPSISVAPETRSSLSLSLGGWKRLWLVLSLLIGGTIGGVAGSSATQNATVYVGSTDTMSQAAMQAHPAVTASIKSRCPDELANVSVSDYYDVEVDCRLPPTFDWLRAIEDLAITALAIGIPFALVGWIRDGFRAGKRSRA